MAALRAGGLSPDPWMRLFAQAAATRGAIPDLMVSLAPAATEQHVGLVEAEFIVMPGDLLFTDPKSASRMRGTL